MREESDRFLPRETRFNIYLSEKGIQARCCSLRRLEAENHSTCYPASNNIMAVSAESTSATLASVTLSSILQALIGHLYTEARSSAQAQHTLTNTHMRSVPAHVHARAGKCTPTYALPVEKGGCYATQSKSQSPLSLSRVKERFLEWICGRLFLQLCSTWLTHCAELLYCSCLLRGRFGEALDSNVCQWD